MWQLLLFAFISGPDAGKNRDKLATAIAIYVILSMLAGGVAYEVAGAGVRGAKRISRGLVVGIARAYFRIYFGNVPPATAKAAIKSLVNQVLAGTMTLGAWLATYDPWGELKRELDAGSIAEEEDDPLGILQTKP